MPRLSTASHPPTRAAARALRPEVVRLCYLATTQALPRAERAERGRGPRRRRERESGERRLARQPRRLRLVVKEAILMRRVISIYLARGGRTPFLFVVTR